MAFLCGVCNLETTGTRCLLCRSCDIWFHADCENVPKALFSTLDKYRNVAYTCAGCMKDPPGNLDGAFKVEMRKEFAALKDSIRDHATDMKNEHIKITTKFESVVGEIRAELSKSLHEIKDDVSNCKSIVFSHDLANKNKFFELELQNHVLQHRLNRSDIVVTGLPDNLDVLGDVVRNLCNHLKVDFEPADILNIMYIRKRHAILVKFSQTSKRDSLMSTYFKSKSLKVSDVVGGGNDNRVFLNDNFSSLANKLQKYCWKLKNDKKIIGYSIINREMLKTKIIMPNNEVKIISIQECMNLFKINS